MSRSLSGAVTLLATAAILAACGGGDDAAEGQGTPREQFFANMAALCGQSYAGQSATPGHELANADLRMHIESCTDSMIRVPFIVDGDRSRTWVLTLSGEGLLLKHDHRHPDGTPEDPTMYGGWAAEGGTATMQRFPADTHTATIIPEAATNVWTLEIDRERERFIYDLIRDGQPRFRAEFDMSAPLAGGNLPQ
jgi:hypothetical protein